MAQTTTTIIGNLTHDPDLVHFEKSNSDKGRLRVAVNRRIRDNDGNWSDGAPLYISVDIWGPLAVNSKKSLGKGMPVIITGTLTTEIWVDKDNNQRQQILLRGTHVGLDLNRYVVGSKRSGTAEKNDIGVELPDSSTGPTDYDMIYSDQSGTSVEDSSDSQADTAADAAASQTEGQASSQVAGKEKEDSAPF